MASQALSHQKSEDSAIDMMIHRPLIGLDKNEVIEMAKDIRSYEISIQPGICSKLIPDGPRVKSSLNRVLREERKIDYFYTS